jgi:membrane associated rhomboid family serine protease
MVDEVITVGGIEYHMKPSPLVENNLQHARDIENQIDVGRPKNFSDEAMDFFHDVYKWCTPEPKVYPRIFTPIAIGSLWLVFIIMGLTVSNTYCNSIVNICSEAFIQVPFGGLYIDVMKSETWRLITAGYQHYSFLHVGLNTLMIFFAGRYIEPKYGADRLWIVFFGSIIGGNIICWLAYPPGNVIVGASGGCYGLVFLFLADCVLNWETVKYRWTLTSILIIATIASMLIEGLVIQGVAVLAHFGGAVSAFWISIMILPNFYYRPFERYLTIVCFICFLIQFPVLIGIAFAYK